MEIAFSSRVLLYIVSCDATPRRFTNNLSPGGRKFLEAMQFVLNNWYLFLALIVVLALLVAPIVMQQIYRIKSLGPGQSVLLMNRQSGVVIDVSEPAEYNAGHIPNAVSAPFSGLAQGAAALDKYKARPIIVVGRNNQRAMKAATLLRKRGFESVSLLAGGIAAWEKESLPLEK